MPGGFKAARRKVRLTPEALTRSYYLDDERKLPLVIEPRVSDLDPVAWAESHSEYIATELAQHGALLLRGFDIPSVERFEQFIRATSGGALPYHERSSPRSQVSGNIYTSTDYPAPETIFLHNEQSYNLQFPLKIYFFCLVPANEGGETPIADTRKILASIRSKYSRSLWKTRLSCTPEISVRDSACRGRKLSKRAAKLKSSDTARNMRSPARGCLAIACGRRKCDP